MIRVITNNFQESMVDEHVLGSLIESNKLIAFYRSDEWVVIGKDSVRVQHTLHQGKERRRIVCGNDFFMK